MKDVGTLADALCADFDRRAQLAIDESAPLRCRLECRYLNLKLWEAVREVCESDGEARLFLYEIGERVGYARSKTTLSETAYKKKKADIRQRILRSLHLL